MVCLGLQLWWFQYMINWIHCFGSRMGQHAIVEACGRRSYLPHEVLKTNEKGGRVPTVPFKNELPIMQLILTRSRLLKSPSTLNHGLKVTCPMDLWWTLIQTIVLEIHLRKV